MKAEVCYSLEAQVEQTAESMQDFCKRAFVQIVLVCYTATIVDVATSRPARSCKVSSGDSPRAQCAARLAVFPRPGSPFSQCDVDVTALLSCSLLEKVSSFRTFE
jgi:hypothetical protein